MSDVIFTPVFRETRYLHHICSECGYKINVTQEWYGGIHFHSSDGIKFCPHCGKPVVRFSDQAIFETPIDFEPMRIFYELREEYERKRKWLYHCYISVDRKDKIEKLLQFAEEQSGWVEKAYDAISKEVFSRPDWRTRNKLLAEFGDESEG